MALKRMDLNKRCFYVQSGLSNALGKILAVEMCRRFKPGSIAVFFDADEDSLIAVKKDVEFLYNKVKVVNCVLDSWQQADRAYFDETLATVLADHDTDNFELAYIMHNEGTGATERLIEPHDVDAWKSYVQQHLNAAVALNQEFINLPQMNDVEKLVVNITSSVPVKPFVYKTLNCSCKKARNMYFRAMADMEHKNYVSVLSYLPGIFEFHKPELDENNNLIDLLDMNIDKKLLKLQRAKPLNSALKLINILEEMSFISGHDVDYYDTYNL